jgi:uncharacterized protein YbjT (DUF2867 family)
MDIGAREIVIGDLRDSSSLEKAVRGVQAVYHISPNVSPHELSIGRSIIAQVKAAEVNRFVYHSVLHPQTESMPHHWLKMQVEELIFKSGLPFTIIQPAPYMQNLLTSWQSVVETGVYQVPYPTDTPFSLVDLQDVADVAAKVLTESDHVGAIYELAGPEVITPDFIAEVLSDQLERQVISETISVVAWKKWAESSGMDKYQIETLVKMFVYYERNGLWGNSNVTRWLLGRQPTNFATFAHRRVMYLD